MATSESRSATCMIAIGASLGGVDSLQTLVSHFDAGLPAAVLIVLHLSPNRRSHLARILAAASALPVSEAVDGEHLRAGHVYVAPPDHHMVVRDSSIALERGPRENRVRPAIDPLFRTAAWAYGANLAAVVLSGMQGDGTVGLMAVKANGGMTIVQDPDESAQRSMPDSAIRYVDVDHVAKLRAIASLVIRFANECGAARATGAHGTGSVNPRSERIQSDLRKQAAGQRTGDISTYACPECGGTLWEVDERGLISYACHVGHAYAPESLLAQKSEALETALWAAVRTMVERSSLTRQLAGRMRDSGKGDEAASLDEQATEEERNMHLIRQLITRSVPTPGEVVDLEPPEA